MTNEEFIKSISEEGEEWRDVIGYEGLYAISNYGRAISLPRIIEYSNGRHRPTKGRLLKLWNSSYSNEDGNYYKLITITTHNKPINEFIHRLVAKHFVDNPNNYNMVDHIDGNPSNNHYCNLRWCTQTINMNNPVAKKRSFKNQYHPKNHPSTSKPILRISDSGESVQYASINDASRDGYSRSKISCCCNGHIKKYKGYFWKFI